MQNKLYVYLLSSFPLAALHLGSHALGSSNGSASNGTTLGMTLAALPMVGNRVDEHENSDDDAHGQFV